VGILKTTMTKRLFIIILSLTSLKAVSQSDTLRLDDFHGQTIADTGKVVILTTYTHNLSGAINGSFKGKAIYNFHFGQKNGLSIVYWHNGEKYIEDNYKNGKRDGASKLFGLSGSLENYNFFKNDSLTIAIWYYSNGTKRIESIKDSNDTSYYYERFENGQLKYSKFTYNDSIVAVNYYDSGKIKDKDVLIIKTRVHHAKLWSRQGVLLKEKYFAIDGIYEGPLPKEIIYEPEIIKKNDEYKSW